MFVPELFLEQLQPSFPITAQGTTVVTWTFNDGNGNSVTANQNVIIDDTVAPICATKNITITVGINYNSK